jgi:hypothetical protein
MVTRYHIFTSNGYDIFYYPLRAVVGTPPRSFDIPTFLPALDDILTDISLMDIPTKTGIYSHLRNACKGT